MTAPLTFGFDVACAPEHAFDVWTSKLGTWWPRDHTAGGERPVEIAMQPGVGGLIVERGSDGVEHVWGRLTVWEPPHRLAYRWHLGRPADAATDVEVRFTAVGDDATRVEIEQRGWERLGDEAGLWRDRNHAGWDSVLPHYRNALEGR
jgi:uncharacterized protein YndB with AHSA1/START domain